MLFVLNVSVSFAGCSDSTSTCCLVTTAPTQVCVCVMMMSKSVCGLLECWLEMDRGEKRTHQLFFPLSRSHKRFHGDGMPSRLPGDSELEEEEEVEAGCRFFLGDWSVWADSLRHGSV